MNTSTSDSQAPDAEPQKRKRDLEKQLAAHTEKTSGGSTQAVSTTASGEPHVSTATNVTALREAFAEAFETIHMLEQALSPLANPPYAAFFRACSNGSAAEVRSLVLSGLIDINHFVSGVTGLHLAACNGHSAVVQTLVDHGCFIDARLGMINAPYRAELVGATPYILAEANGKQSVASILRANGADTTARTDNGHTADTLIPCLRETIPGLRAINMTVQ